MVEAVNIDSKKVQEVKKEFLMMLKGQVPALPLKLAPTPQQQPSAPLSNTPTFPGMPANLPNLPNGMQPNPELMQKIMGSPDILRAMQNPALMAKLQQIMSDPSKISQFQNDAELMDLMKKMSTLM